MRPRPAQRAWWSVRGAATSLLLVVTVVAFAGDQGPSADHPLAAVESSCIRTGPIDDVDQLNTFVANVRGNADFAGGDVGASVQLQDGRHLFVYGDTVRVDGSGVRTSVRNSMLLFGSGCGRVVVPPGHGAVVPNRVDGVGYWPMSTARVARAGYDLVGVSVQRVRTTSGVQPFGFEILGPAGALFKVPNGGTPQLLGVRDYGPDLVDTTRPMWGAAVVVDGGWAYLYGTSRTNQARLGGFALHVGRLRTEDLLLPERWRFWNGRRWVVDAGGAAVLIPADGGVSETLSVFRRGDRWFAVSKRDEVLGSDLTIWTGDRPTGPFVVGAVAAQIPSDAATGTFRYMPLAHPDLLPLPGTVLVSYSQNYADYSVVQEDPRRYRPRFLRIALPGG